MKGLLVKDIALILQRKRVIIFLLVWAIVMAFTMEDGSFIVGWLTIVSASFAISSIAYDEYDNCMPFLMSLPANGKTYAKEKYLFGILCGFAAWLFAGVTYLIAMNIRGFILDYENEMIQLLLMIPVFLILIDVSLPLNLKYGSEHGRIVSLVIWGVMFGLFMLFSKFLNIEISFDISSISMTTIVIAVFAAAAAFTIVSLILSLKIMEKKEY